MTPLRKTVEVPLSCHLKRSEWAQHNRGSALSCHPERSEGSQSRGVQHDSKENEECYNLKLPILRKM